MKTQLAVAAALLMVCSPSGFAEVNATNSTGVEPMYAYKGGLIESINLYNGNVNVQVPLLQLKGRAGLDLQVLLSYDSRQFRFFTDAGGYLSVEWNYKGPTVGRWMASFAPYLVLEWTSLDANGYTVHNAEIALEGGSRHQFSGYYPTGDSSNATDMKYYFDSKLLVMKGGTWYNFSNPNSVKKGDANGNYITFTRDGSGRTTQITDTLGRTINIYYEHASDTTIPTRMTVLNHAGQTLTYTFEYEFKYVGPYWYGYGTYILYGNHALLTRINLPDGKFWAFTYLHQPPPGTSSMFTLSRVDYPTGGYTIYNYTGGNTQPKETKLSQRIVNANNGQGEITTTYQHSHCNTCPNTGDSWAKAIDPDSSSQQSDFDALSGVEIRRYHRNAAGTDLRRESNQWTSSSTGYRVTTAYSYIGPTWSPWWSQRQYTYDPQGNLTDESVTSGFYTGVPSFKFRRTIHTYQSIGPIYRPSGYFHYIWRPLEETVTDYDWGNYAAHSRKTKYTYDEFALTSRSGMPGHDTTAYGTSFTKRGNPTTVSRWLASQSRWIDTKSYYDILGNVTQTTDPRTNSTTFEYSSTFHFAYPTRVTNAKGHAVNTNYSFYTGLVTSLTNENNFTTTTTFDSLNRISRIDNPDGGYTRFAYDLTVNNFATTIYRSITATQEASMTTYLDGLGREKQKKTSDPAGDIYVDTVYSICDCTGKTAKVSNPYRAGETVYWTERQYDALGRVTKIIPPDGTPSANHTSYTYDLTNPITTVTDAAGKSKRFHYDVLGRILKVVEPDASGQLTLETNYNYFPIQGNEQNQGTLQNRMHIYQGVQTREFLYDTLGRLTSEIHPENGTTSYSYDDSGNVLNRTDARGWVRVHSYDELNRLTAKTYQNDGGVTPAVTLTYDTSLQGVGKLANWTSGSHSGNIRYDGMGRVYDETKTIGGLSGTVGYAYNLAGQLTTTYYPFGGYYAAQNLDSVGNPETITTNFAGTLVTNVDRNAAGASTLVAYGNGVTNTRTYNTGLQLSNVTVTGSGGGYLNQTYFYNAGVSNNGRIVSITDNLDSTKTLSYTYDELNRLKTAATGGTHWGLSWTYDRYGNRLSQSLTKGSAPTQSFAVDTVTNRVNGWSYDAAGNVTNDGAKTYVYDAENRLISINGGATTYAYDAFGARIQKTSGGTTTRYYFGLAETVNGAWGKLYVGTPAGVVEWENSVTIYKSNDHLGNGRVITNTSGAVVGRLDVYPYGEAWSETGATSKFKYTGKERDSESSNDYFGARYYWSAAGRWLGVDPEFGDFSDPQRLNRYMYGLSDPVNLVDPDGRNPIPFIENICWTDVETGKTYCTSPFYKYFPNPYNPNFPRPPVPAPSDILDEILRLTKGKKEQLSQACKDQFNEFARDAIQAGIPESERQAFGAFLTGLARVDNVHVIRGILGAEVAKDAGGRYIPFFNAIFINEARLRERATEFQATPEQVVPMGYIHEITHFGAYMLAQSISEGLPIIVHSHYRDWLKQKEKEPCKP